MESYGQIVMPVFYDIDPSDVRKFKRKYEEAFFKHEGENECKVESWRKALVKASNLSGWVTKDFANGHEAECIKDVVATISKRLSLVNANVNNDFIGIETRLQDLKSKLEIGLCGVRMVGIWGVGGGGKTTLASAAYVDISNEFEASCLLENIRDESRKHGLKGLQETFLSFILKTKVRLESEIEGKKMIKRRLCHKNVLVVLDDVDDLKQLDALAGSHDWFGEGSRIIITTRDEHLLTRQADTIYEVRLLSHGEAIKLFSKHAYRELNPVEDYESLSLSVVSYAGGLPLALKVLGSFLYDKDKDEWMSTLTKLKSIPDREVMERLKISYDGLEPYQQNLFLDIACFLRGWEIEEAMMVLDACSFYPRIGVKVLLQKSLIKVSKVGFDMHDLIEEMAHYIVRGEHPNNPEKYTRIWKQEDIVDLCDMGIAASLMDTEVYVLRSYANHPRLLDVVANMKKLRWIKLHRQTCSLPLNFLPTRLGCLMSRSGLQNEMWQGYKHLPNLKILDLRGSAYLIQTPDFDGLPSLERLILKGCTNLAEIHPSIGYHKRLVYVNMKGCKGLQMFPPIIGMPKLETLLFCKCYQLHKFPDIRTNLDSLVTLDLGYTYIEIIPLTLGKFCTNLVSLNLSDCYTLKRIEGNFHLLKRLKDLNLYRCYHLRSRLQSFSRGENSLCITFPQFPRFIRKLNLSSCNLEDGDIPYDICELLNLQLLDISGNMFSQLPSSISRIPCLKFLNLSCCKSLVEFPDLPSSIAILDAGYCYSIESVGDLSKYKWLWKVSLWEMNKLIGGNRVLRSLLQVNALEDRFMSVILPSKSSLPICDLTFMSVTHPPKPSAQIFDIATLQLPHNWESDFSGFLLCAEDYQKENESCKIVIKQEMCIHSQLDHDHLKEFITTRETYEFTLVGYVPFRSLRHVPWWNSAYTKSISFEIYDLDNPQVGLVPREGKIGDLRETQKGTTDCSDFWDDEFEDRKTFEIIYDSKSSNIEIVWSHV